MQRQISKKFFIYLFTYLLLVSVNNIKFLQLNFPTINNFEISGMSDLENDKLRLNLENIKNNDIFFMDKEKVSEIIYSNKKIERFSIFKNYPSKLEIKIEKTNFLAITKKNNIDFYIGSNGNLIKIENLKTNLPFVFGNVDILDFIHLKEIIDNSNFDFNKIENLYYFKSKRWDLQTKDGLIIKLPLSKIENSLNALKILSKQEEFKDIKTIDLRQINQVILNG